MNAEFKEALYESPIIAAVKDDDGLEEALRSDSNIIFVLYGDVISISDIVARIKDSGKMAFVHVDLTMGLSSKDVAVDFIKKYTKADGIISTRAASIKRARELGLATVMRFFMIDSMAYAGIKDQIIQSKPDVIELLPGLMPKIVKKVATMTKRPIIAGGLISDREDVMSILDAGATAVSSTNQDVWRL